MMGPLALAGAVPTEEAAEKVIIETDGTAGRASLLWTLFFS